MTLMEAAPRETAHEAGGYLKGVAVALVTVPITFTISNDRS